MTDTADNTPPERPAFDALVADLRTLVRQQGEASLAKAEAARRNATLVMAKAAELFAAGRISGTEYTHLHAVRLRLNAMIPLPGDQPSALDASALRPIDGDE